MGWYCTEFTKYAQTNPLPLSHDPQNPNCQLCHCLFLAPLIEIDEAKVLAEAAKNSILNSAFHSKLHDDIKNWSEADSIKLVIAIDQLRLESKGESEFTWHCAVRCKRLFSFHFASCNFLLLCSEDDVVGLHDITVHGLHHS